MNKNDLKIYMKNQYYSNLKYMKNLPIWTAYNKAFDVNTDGIEYKARNGMIKKQFTSNETIHTLDLKYFDKDDLYKLERESTKIAIREDYFNFLYRKYNVSRTEVLEAENAIYQALTSGSGVIESDALLKIINVE